MGADDAVTVVSSVFTLSATRVVEEDGSSSKRVTDVLNSLGRAVRCALRSERTRGGEDIVAEMVGMTEFCRRAVMSLLISDMSYPMISWTTLNFHGQSDDSGNLVLIAVRVGTGRLSCRDTCARVVRAFVRYDVSDLLSSESPHRLSLSFPGRSDWMEGSLCGVYHSAAITAVFSALKYGRKASLVNVSILSD